MSNAFTLSYALLWGLVVFQGLVLLGLVRVLFRLQTSGVELSALSGNEDQRGELSPSFTGRDLSGNWVKSEEFAGTKTLLLFTSAKCRSCSAALDDLEPLKHKADGRLIVVCSGGGQDECLRLSVVHELDVPVVLDEDSAISRLFGIDLVPTAVLIDEHGLIQSYGNPLRDGEPVGERLNAPPTEEGVRV